MRRLAWAQEGYERCMLSPSSDDNLSPCPVFLVPLGLPITTARISCRIRRAATAQISCRMCTTVMSVICLFTQTSPLCSRAWFFQDFAMIALLVIYYYYYFLFFLLLLSFLLLSLLSNVVIVQHTKSTFTANYLHT